MMRTSRALALAAALATSAAQATAATCDWSRPGVMDYQGEVPAAVDSYTDIPAATRARLKARMAARQYDELVTITHDAILGAATYSPEIWDMHWRGGLCRGTASRAGWRPTDTERGLVYCEDGHCILVPTVCRNVSRVKRLAGRPPAATQRPPADGPIDITPSAGTWGDQQPLPPLAGDTGLRVPSWAIQADPSAMARGAGLPGGLLLMSEELDAVAPAATGWQMEQRTFPGITDATPAPLPILLPAPVPAIPEAPTWAVMSMGAALIFLASRRHRREPSA